MLTRREPLLDVADVERFLATVAPLLQAGRDNIGGTHGAATRRERRNKLQGGNNRDTTDLNGGASPLCLRWPLPVSLPRRRGMTCKLS